MSFPELRHGPPWVMEDMIALQPGLAGPIAADRQAAAAIAEIAAGVAAKSAPIVVTGCGTSEHAAMAVAALLRDVAPGQFVVAREAFEASLEPQSGGLCLAISHEGETAATVAALKSARARGAATAVITAVAGAPVTRFADDALVTPTVDRSWCHTVGFLSPILAGGAIAAAFSGRGLPAEAVSVRISTILAMRDAAMDIGRRLAGLDRVVAVGSGLDLIAARELALKVEEGARSPAVGRALETQLHGHLASADDRCGLIVIVTDPAAHDRRQARAEQLLGAAQRLGMPAAGIVSEDVAASWPADLTSAGRLVVPDPRPAPGLAAPLATIVQTAVAVQLLTVGLIHAAGTNPDRIRREEPAYAEAAAIAEVTGPIS